MFATVAFGPSFCARLGGGSGAALVGPARAGPSPPAVMLRSRPAAVVRDITQFFEDKRFDPDAEIKLYDIAKLMLFLKRDDDTHARTEKKNLQTWLAATYPPTFTNVTATMLPDIIRGFLNIELDDDALLNSILTRKRGAENKSLQVATAVEPPPLTDRLPPSPSSLSARSASSTSAIVPRMPQNLLERLQEFDGHSEADLKAALVTKSSLLDTKNRQMVLLVHDKSNLLRSNGRLEGKLAVARKQVTFSSSTVMMCVVTYLSFC